MFNNRNNNNNTSNHKKQHYVPLYNQQDKYNLPYEILATDAVVTDQRSKILNCLFASGELVPRSEQLMLFDDFRRDRHKPAGKLLT